MEYNRAKLKQEVKQSMRQTRPRPIWVALLYMVIVSIGGTVIQSVLGAVMGGNTISAIYAQAYTDALMNGGDLELVMQQMMTHLLQNYSILSGILTGSVLISILNYLWQSLMGMSYVGYSMAMVRGQNPGVKALFSAFPKFGPVILTRVLVGVFTFLWSLLFGAALLAVVFVGALLIALEGAGAVIGVLLIVAAYIAFIVVECWVTLRYAMVDYLVMDQGLSGREAIRVSKELMKGNKGRLFVLQLSFIGWYLIDLAIVVVGTLVMALCMLPMLTGSAGGIFLGVILIFVVFVVVMIGTWLVQMWLTPYTGGAYAKFYEFTLSRRPDLFVKVMDDQAFGNPNYPTLE